MMMMMIINEDQNFHFCPRAASRPRTLVSRTTSLNRNDAVVWVAD